MRGALTILAYFLGTLFLGALLAPPLYSAGHGLADHFPSTGWLRDVPFQRYFDRAMFVAAVLLLWPAVRALGITRWRDLGLSPDPRAGRHLLLGFVAAGGLLWLLGFGLWWRGIYTPRFPPPWKSFGGVALTAAVVAVLEETFFRGALLGLVTRRGERPWRGLVFISALFAVLHFLKPQEHAPPPGGIDWLAGFVLLPRSFWQFGDPLLVVGSFTTLFLVGLVLGGARLLTRSLWLPIGLHAGWIFGMRGFATLSRHPAPPNLWFGATLLSGIGSVVVVLLTGWVVWMAARRAAAGLPGPESSP